MKSEQAVDVLQIVKSLRNQRQRSVQTEAQVQFNLQLTNYTVTFLVRVHLQRSEEHLAHAWRLDANLDQLIITSKSKHPLKIFLYGHNISTFEERPANGANASLLFFTPQLKL